MDKIKAKKKSSPNLTENKTILRPNSPNIQNTPCENIAGNMAYLHPKTAISKEKVGGNDLKVDLLLEDPEILGHKAPENPIQIQPSPPKTDLISRKNPGRFSDLRTFLNLSSSLVGTANFYRVTEPSVGTTEVKKKRRYTVKKKEAELVGNSSNSIRNYFPKKEVSQSSEICKHGKRKLTIDATEVSKKARVGIKTID